MRYSAAAGCLIALLGQPAKADEAHAYFYPHQLSSHLTGDARQSSRGRGTRINFDKTFNVDPTEPTGEVDGFVRFRRYRIEFGYTRVENAGHATIKDDIRYGGNRYFAGSTLFMVVEPDRERLAFGYDFIETKKVSLGPTVGVERLHVETRINYRCCGNADVTAMTYYTPVAGGSFGFHPLRSLAIHARTVGIYLDRTKLVDGAITLECLIVGRVGAAVGYTYYHFNYAEHRFKEVGPPDDMLELTQHGWTAGLVLHL